MGVFKLNLLKNYSSFLVKNKAQNRLIRALFLLYLRLILSHLGMKI